jgi:hypothetical protein
MVNFIMDSLISRCKEMLEAPITIQMEVSTLDNGIMTNAKTKAK